MATMAHQQINMMINLTADITRLNIQPDETLILQIRDDITHQQMATLQREAAELFDCKVRVIQGNVDLTIIKNVDLPPT